jgi:hypothetical protein
MYGKGIYFGNKIEMSFSYGQPGMSNGVGIYILAEVALGDIMDANREWNKGNSSINETNINPGKNSTMNGTELDPKDFETILDKVSVPFVKDSNTNYNNMYIVYNTNQVRLRYIVRIR